MGITLTEAHKYQYQMALIVKKICEINNISYFLDAGTLLGSIRDNGFIPWDDDIDIGFTRENYELFIKIVENYLPSNIYLQKWDKDKAYGYPYAKLRYLGTDYSLETDGNSSAITGVFLDLLPYDKIPNNKIGQNIHRIKLRILYLLIQYKLNYNPLLDKKGIVVFFCKKFSKIFNVDKMKLMYEKIVKKYNIKENNVFVTEADGIDYSRFIMKKEYIEETIQHIFEKEMFTIPKQYDNYLRTVYGDYLVLPKKNEQQSKHKVLNINYNK